MAESKSRLLYILKYLWQNTDAEHYATTADILAFLKGNGISCDRKTIPGDIAKLCDIGIDIEEERSRENRYSLSSHLFTLPELKLLIDAVESSKFITVNEYDPMYLNGSPRAVPIETIIEKTFGLRIEYQYLTNDARELGRMIYDSGITTYYDRDRGDYALMRVEGGTMLIEASLLEDERC